MTIFFENQFEFRAWLEKHHQNGKELVVGFYKVGSGKPSMLWSESVDQALCFGWIDGVRKSIDHESYCIRFTPRKPNSIWSAINIKKIEVLTEAGLMKPEGLKAFALRTEALSKIYGHEREAATLPPDYLNQFKQHQTAWRFFMHQAPSYRKVTIHWIMSAKQDKTRLARLNKAIAASEQERRLA